MSTARGNNDYDGLVVGMGPVGLAAAYEMAKTGKKVLIIEKRSEAESALRPQVVVLEPARKRQLCDMIRPLENLSSEDIKFLNELAASSEIQLSAVQRFILNRINNLNQSNDTGAALIDRQYQTELSSVDLAEGRAIVQSKHGAERDIQFGHLIAADGARSETLTLVNESLDKKNQIGRGVQPGMKYLEKTYHMGAYVELSRRDGGNLALPEKEFVSAYLTSKTPKGGENLLYFLRFDKKSHAKSDNKHVKLGFIGEVPQSEYEKLNQKVESINAALQEIRQKKKEANGLRLGNQRSTAPLDNLERGMMDDLHAAHQERKALAIAYVQRAAAHYLNVSKDDLTVKINRSKKTPAKDRLKLLTFKGGNQKAQRAAISENDHGFYLVGDAYLTPNYPVGHGLNNGLESANMLSQLPVYAGKTADKTDSNLQTHKNDYNKLASNNAGSARSLMLVIRIAQKFNWTRRWIAKRLGNTVAERESDDRLDLTNGLSHTKGGANYPDSIEAYLRSKFDLFKFEDLFNNSRKDGRFNPPEAEVLSVLERLRQFLSDGPAIVKQYHGAVHKIIDEMGKLIEPLGNDAMRQAFNLTKAKYQAIIDEYGQSLLQAAAANPNKIDGMGCTPLDRAYDFGDMNIMKAVLAQGSSPFKPRFADMDYNGHMVKHSSFSASLAPETSLFNPLFAIECLLAYKNRESLFTKEARNDLPASHVTLMLSVVREMTPAVWKKGFALDTLDKGVINALLDRMEPKVSHAGLSNDAVLSKLQDLTAQSLEFIRNEKTAKFKLMFSTSHGVGEKRKEASETDRMDAPSKRTR